jgi:GntR family transcriptional regulator
MPHDPTRLPVYLQISESLIREIGAGRLVAGQRLAPEREMAEAHGVSVGTLRKSLKALEDHGLLERVHGSGNYIRTNEKAAGVYSMFRLERPEGGGLPRADVLDVAMQQKPDDLPGFGTTQRGTRIRRLRFLDEAPAAVEEIWLDSGAGEIVAEDLSESLYRTYQDRLRLWIRRAEDRVSVAQAPKWAPDAFEKRGHIVGYVERLAWGDAPAPVEFSRTWFDPDRARYVQRLG